MRHDNDLHRAAQAAGDREHWYTGALWAGIFLSLLAVAWTLLLEWG